MTMRKFINDPDNLVPELLEGYVLDRKSVV